MGLIEGFDRCLTPTRREITNSFGLLLLRIGAGCMMMTHGWGKLSTFSEMAETFPDPIGVGSTVSLALAVFAEFFCAILIAVGLATRLAAVPLIVTMAVAAFSIHAADPFRVKEFALLYMTMFITLFFTGPGQISLDAAIWHRARK